MRAQDVVFTSLMRCGEDIVVGRVSRPDGYEFSPGQWFRLGLQTEGGIETRTLSHASAPADAELEFATRLSDSAFKRALARMRKGDCATVMGPGGRTNSPSDKGRVVFLAGGVGITSGRSMLRHASQSGSRFADALVVHGDRDPSCAVYDAELKNYADIGVRVVQVFEAAPVGHDGERGFITAEMLRRYGAEADGRIFHVAGPPGMVRAMGIVLDELGVAASDRRLEAFGAVAPPAEAAAGEDIQ